MAYFKKLLTNVGAIHHALSSYEEFTPAIKNRLVLLIILMMTVNQMSVSIYLPSMPGMVYDLQTNMRLVQLSLPVFVLAFGCSQFFYGPFSDIYGRRLIALVGFAIFVVASLLATLAPDIHLFLVARALQGIGVACGDTMGRAILCDRFNNKEFVRAASYISMAATITPLVAPILGGYLEYYLNWHANFAFLFLYGSVCFIILLLYLPETKPKYIDDVKNLRSILNAYWFILRNPIFLGFFIPGLVSYFCELFYSMKSPFILQQKLGLSAVEFGWLSIFIICGLLIGALIANVFSHRASHYKMVRAGIMILIAASIFMLIPALFKYISILAIMLPMTVFMIGVGITYPNTNMGALTPFTAMAGTAGALQGGMQMISAALLSMAVGGERVSGQLSLALTLLLTAIAGLLLFTFFLKNASTKHSHQPEQTY